MQKKLGFVVVLAVAGSLVVSGVSLAGLCADLGKDSQCITSIDIKNFAVKKAKVAKDAVNGNRIEDGSVATVDLADNAVTSAKMDADISLGDAADSGSLVVQASNLRNYLYVYGTDTYGYAFVGQSGGTGMDVDFRVYDPTESDYAAQIDASAALLILGSGSAANPGDDGDIYVEDGEGAVSVNIDGNAAALYLGVGSAATPGNDGDIIVRNNVGTDTFVVDGQTGNVANTFGGQGLVKAWARINANGTVASCWRCNTSAAETRWLNTGQYEVDFTPLSTNIRSRPKMAVAYTDENFGLASVNVVLTNRSDASSVGVLVSRTWESVSQWINYPFTIIIY